LAPHGWNGGHVNVFGDGADIKIKFLLKPKQSRKHFLHLIHPSHLSLVHAFIQLHRNSLLSIPCDPRTTIANIEMRHDLEDVRAVSADVCIAAAKNPATPKSLPENIRAVYLLKRILGNTTLKVDIKWEV